MAFARNKFCITFGDGVCLFLKKGNFIDEVLRFGSNVKEEGFKE